MHSDGSKDAVSFIKKHQKTGRVVDFYSDRYISSLDPDINGITIENLDDYDKKHGRSYRGHMLAIYIGDEDEETLNELGNLYPPLKTILQLKGEFRSREHRPDLLLINLLTREILCVGLGRKNRSFSFELHKYLKYQTNSNNKCIDGTSPSAIDITDCSTEFFALDYFNIARNTVEAMDLLGKYYFEYDNLPGNADVMVTLNKKDGLYYFDDFAAEEGMTKAEVKSLEERYENIQEWIDDELHTLRTIFPKIADWDLNTGDY